SRHRRAGDRPLGRRAAVRRRGGHNTGAGNLDRPSIALSSGRVKHFNTSATSVVSELEAFSGVSHLTVMGNILWRPKVAMTLALNRSRIAHGSTLILLTMSLGVLIAQIDTSVVNLAVKQIGAKLDAGVTALQWVVDSYNLVYASLLLTAGTLADLYGRRRIFALGIALFTLGSLVCGLAPNAIVLVAGRAIAGLGAALEVPTSLAILTVAYPDTKKRTQALGLWASCNGLAFII